MSGISNKASSSCQLNYGLVLCFFRITLSPEIPMDERYLKRNLKLVRAFEIRAYFQ